MGKSSSSSSSSRGGSNLCLSLKHAGQVLSIGRATDFGYCKSYRNEPGSHGKVKGMVKCKNIVNVSKGDFCEYHVRSEYKKILLRRPEVNQSRDRSVVPFTAKGGGGLNPTRRTS